MTIDRHDEACCGVCGRNATGFGYSPKSTAPPIWVCDDLECLRIAKDSYLMKQDRFDRLEAMAAVKAAEEMGAELERIGKVQGFEHLTWEEWLDVARAGIRKYRGSLKSLVRDEAPF